MRVLSICTSDSSGGAARAAYRIHLSVRELGVDSKMFVREKRTNDENVIPLNDFLPRNFLYRLFDWIRNKIKNKIQHLRWSDYPKQIPYYLSDLRSTDICGALKRIEYDVLHLHWINSRFLPLEALPKDKPIVWTLHDSWPFCGICHYFLGCEAYKTQCGNCPHLGSVSSNDLSHQVWKRKNLIYKSLDLHIVAPSQWLGECAKKSNLLGGFPCCIIPNSIDVDRFRPLERIECPPPRLDLQILSENKPLVLFGAMNVANDAIKGFSNLLSALRILEKEGKSDLFELVVFGTNDPLDGIPVSIPVHYVGYVYNDSEMVSLYNLAAVTVVPSLTENLSCTIMESLSCGTPVVAFDLGGNGDMIDHQKNGYLAKALDNDDLAKGIVWCIDNRDYCNLSVNARSKVLSHYSMQIIGNKYYELYHKVVS